MIPTLTTQRLTLRAPKFSDFEAYAAMRADDRMAHIGGPQTRAQAWQHLAGVAGQWTLRGYGRWIVTLTGEDAPIGLVGIHHAEDWPEPEIGWTMAAHVEGHGYAREAALATRAHAYGALGMTTIVSMVAPDNTRSEGLARRLGCRPDGVFRHDVWGEMTIWRHPSPEDLA